MILNFILIFLFVSIDFISKMLVVKHATLEAITPLYGDFSLNYMQTFVGYSLSNDTIDMLSVLNSVTNLHYFQYLISFIAIIIMLFVLKQKPLNEKSIKSFLPRLICLLIISGVLGNMINLFYLGYVVDFIRIHTASDFVIIFNVADIYLHLAPALIVVMFIYLIFEKVLKKQ